MPRLPLPPGLAPGPRTLVAQTCTGCDRLLDGRSFERRPRTPGGPAYLDRRCRSCRWAKFERSYGR